MTSDPVHAANGEPVDAGSHDTPPVDPESPPLGWWDKLMPLREAAEILDLSPGWLRTLHRRGKVLLVKPGGEGGKWYMPTHELYRLLGKGRDTTWK